MFVTETLRHPGGAAGLAKVTGDDDKAGLPDPLELRFYFALAGDAIAQLVVIPAKCHLKARKGERRRMAVRAAMYSTARTDVRPPAMALRPRIRPESRLIGATPTRAAT